MELSERCIAQLEKEGWQHIYEWQDKPHTVYDTHSHQGEVVLFVTEGAVTVAINDGRQTLQPGERLHIPAQTPHHITVGPRGAQYVIAEEIAGDS